MRFEVENKYRSSAQHQVLDLLLERGAVEEAEVTHEDIYLKHPSRDFAQTNEALRIRRVGSSNHLTYKGPKRAGPTKTREEIELTFEEGDPAFAQLLQLFKNLGFSEVAVVRKTRRCFRISSANHHLNISLDSAAELGDFVEVEAIAQDESDLPSAQALVIETANWLGLTQLEPRSYLRMLLELRANAR